MDEQQLLHACELVDRGRFNEAYREFVHLAEDTPDPLERAWPLLYAAKTLQTLGQEQAADVQLSAARALIASDRPLSSANDEKFKAAELFLDFVAAEFFLLRGGELQAALDEFDMILEKHKSTFQKSFPPFQPFFRGLCRWIQIRRAFILADLGRWKEALPILEGIESPQEFREGVAFYLGHCYLAAGDYDRSEQKLAEALRLGGLPHSLEYRAHSELGMTYYQLKNYAKAKTEFEKGAQMGDTSYIRESQIWKWLELTCRALGLEVEAEQYARMAKPS